MFDNITLTEAFFILIFALIFVKPDEYHRIYLFLGKLLRKTLSSEAWRSFTEMRRNIERLPNQMIRDAEKDELSQVREKARKTDSNSNASKQPEGDNNNE